VYKQTKNRSQTQLDSKAEVEVTFLELGACISLFLI